MLKPKSKLQKRLKITTTILGFFVFGYVSKGYVIRAVIYLKTFY